MKVRSFLGNSLYLKMIAIIFYYWDGISVSMFSYLGLGLTLSLDSISPKEQSSGTHEMAFTFG